MIYAYVVRNADADGRDEIDTALNAGVSGSSQEESAEEYQARQESEMAMFQQLESARRG